MSDDQIETLTSPGHLAVYHGAFGPMKTRVKAFPIIGFDTEDDTRGVPLSFAFHDGNKSFYTKSADRAIDYIYNYPDTAIFMAHNLEYDIGNLFKHCDYRYIKEMVYASRLLKVSLIGTSHFFLNTSSFFAGSLAKMGKIVGLKKLDGDSLNKEYNIRDAEIVQVFGARFQERLNARGVNLGLSIGQIAMNIFRTNFLRKKQRTYNSGRCLDAYYGGRVELFYKGALPGPIYVSDINSSYPDVMRRYEYPDTSYMEDSSIYSHAFGVGCFTVRVPDNLFVPVLPVHSESGRLFFPKGIVKGWWTYAEVRHALAHGCEIVAEHAGEGTNRGCRPFVEFIDTHYDERQAWKRRGKLNPSDVEAAFEDLTLKLTMNNLYGKFGQHKDASKMTRVKLSPNELKKIGAHIEHKRGPFYAYRMPREKPPRTANYMWAAYVTSYARISLHEKLQAVHDAGGVLLYCDTDSVMFTGEKACNALQYGDSLGLMSLEKFDYAIFRASKGYLLCNEVQRNFHYSKGKIFRGGCELAAGIPRRFVSASLLMPGPRTYEIKKVACKGVPTHLARDFILKGMASVLKPMRLKEAEIRLNAEGNKHRDSAFFKDIGVNVWREVNKWMRSVYIKRSGDEGITYPVDAADIPDLEEKAFGTSAPIDLHGARILEMPKKEDAFRSMVIPPDWFSDGETDIEEEEHKYFSSQEIHFLKREECLELNPGDLWFSGEVMEQKIGKFGRYYILFLKEYLGKKVARKNILAAITEKYFLRFGADQKIYRKRVDFFLLEKYLGENHPLKVRVKILP